MLQKGVKKDFLRRTEKLVEELWHYVIGESKKRVVVRQGSGFGVKFYPTHTTTTDGRRTTTNDDDYPHGSTWMAKKLYTRFRIHLLDTNGTGRIRQNLLEIDVVEIEYTLSTLQRAKLS